MLVWIPLMVTIWVTWFFTDALVLGVERLIHATVLFLNEQGQRYESLSLLQNIHYRRGLGFLVAVALFLTTGLLTRYIVGRRIIAFGERMLQRIPLIRRVYTSVKQIRDAIVDRPGAMFQKVCLVEYPRPGLWAIGFVTSEAQGIVQEEVNKELIAVFVPTTPNPTSGYLVYLPPGDVLVINLSIEDAMKAIVSAGAFLPPAAGGKTGDDCASMQE